jgi:hypothetical protein
MKPWQVLAVTLASVGALNASATVLTFDKVAGTFGSEERIPQDYGDNVAATEQGGFVYGADGGFTPNVTVDWNTGSGTVGGEAAFWGTGFGDLVNVIEAEPEPKGLQFTLTAEPGWLVVLNGFDMATWSSNRTIDALRVLDGADQVLFEELDASIPASGHRSFDFDAPLTASVIKIEFDSSNLGGRSDNIGMDNITFGQVVPEPTSVALLGLAGLVLLRRRGA